MDDVLLVSSNVLLLLEFYFCNLINLKFLKIGITEQSLSKLLKDDLAKLVLDYQDKFDSMLKTRMDDIFGLKLNLLF